MAVDLNLFIYYMIISAIEQKIYSSMRRIGRVMWRSRLLAVFYIIIREVSLTSNLTFEQN